MVPDPIIRTEGLSFSYPNEVLALDSVDMALERGRKVVFLGPNGAGKSTLFLHFNGILRPKTGKVFFEGREVRYDKRSLSSLRMNVGMVLQNPDDQIFSTTVEEDVAFGPMNLRLPREEVEKRIDEALRLVWLEDLRERPTQQLSFGQRKRVSLAGALAMRPKVLIMDEPTAGLDPEMVHELMELSDELNHRGMTMVMSTHDIETAYQWADEMKVMHQGRIIYSGTPEELFADQRLVDRLRLVPPFPVLMNQQLHHRRARPLAPLPKNLMELAEKCFPCSGAIEESVSSKGTVRIIDVNDPDYAAQAEEATRSMEDPHCFSGAYGAKARRLAREGKISVHNSFHAMDTAILQASLGNEYLLYTETPLISLVESNLERLEERTGVVLKAEIMTKRERE